MITLSQIQEFTRDKAICLLGNAKTILNTKKNIDGYNIVCRVNRAFPKNFFNSDGHDYFLFSPYIGSRTDILFIGSDQNIRCKPKITIGYCGLISGLWVDKNKIIKRLPHYYTFLYEDWADLRQVLGLVGDKSPSTGLMSINFLVKYIDFSSLTLFGFNFFETDAWYGNYTPGIAKHDFHREKKYVLNLIKNNKRITLPKE